MDLSGELFSRHTKVEHFDYGVSIKAVINKNTSSQVSSLTIAVLLLGLVAFAVHTLRLVLSRLLVTCIRNARQPGSCAITCFATAFKHGNTNICVYYKFGQLVWNAMSVVERCNLLGKQLTFYE